MGQVDQLGYAPVVRRIKFRQIIQFRFGLRQSQQTALQFALVNFGGVDGDRVAGAGAAGAAGALRPLPDNVGPRGGAEGERAVDMHLRRLSRLQPDAADVGPVRRPVVDEEGSIQVFVPDETGVDAGAGGVIDGKVAKFVVATKQVALLLVHHQFLDHLAVFQDVEMQAGRRLPGPRGNVETAGVRHGGAGGWLTRELPLEA